MISYISIYTSDVIKGLELYNKCLKVNPEKPPLYGKDLEILIPWADWNNYTNILFPTLGELRSLEIKEYLWETDQKLEILSSKAMEGLYKSKYFDLLGNFIGVNQQNEFWFFDGNNRLRDVFSIRFSDIGTGIVTGYSLMNYFELSYVVEKEIFYRRFINSDPKRFESLNNVIKKYKNYE